MLALISAPPPPLFWGVVLLIGLYLSSFFSSGLFDHEDHHVGMPRSPRFARLARHHSTKLPANTGPEHIMRCCFSLALWWSKRLAGVAQDDLLRLLKMSCAKQSPGFGCTLPAPVSRKQKCYADVLSVCWRFSERQTRDLRDPARDPLEKRG